MLPKHIFLSYAAKDLDRAKKLVGVLESSGWSVWWDRDDIPPGEPYRRVITNAIAMVKCVVVLWSCASLESQWVAEEAEEGSKRGVLVPALLDEVEPPLGFRSIESARLVDWTGEPGHPELLLLLRAVASRAGQAALGSVALADAYFDVQRGIIDDHATRFVGRLQVRKALDHFLESQERGYFVIRGGPGQGKTALASHLAKERAFIHHFASRDSSRGDVRLAIRSVLAQLPLGNRALPDGTTQLIVALRERLADQLKGTSRAVILVDAIDELTSSTTEDPLAWFLFDPLPRGLFVILTTRPGDAFDQLSGHLFAMPHRVYDLEPLSDADVMTVLRAREVRLSELQMENLVEAVEGNPLLLHAALAEISADGGVSLSQLPTGIEGYFRRATRAIRAESGELLRRVLGTLSVARQSLSLSEISQIIGVTQRELHDAAIRPIRPYLTELKRKYAFYHRLFADFVRQSLLYEDELANSHRELAQWLTRRDCSALDYRMSALAYHLYHAKDYSGLATHIDAGFLGEKARVQGYSVLEDVELLSRSYLDTGDPKELVRCVQLVEALRTVVGTDVIDETERLVRRARRATGSLRSNVVVQAAPAFDGIDAYVGMLTSAGASADFAELFILRSRFFTVVGDVPGSGLKSAFVARFLANLARKKIERASEADLGIAMSDIRQNTSTHGYFDSVTMQLIELSPVDGVATICNAGHPYPVRYSSKSKSCDRLPVGGGLLSPFLAGSRAAERRPRHVEIDDGDAIIMFSDGLTEAGMPREQPYGYRFERVIELNASKTAKAVGEAILDDWIQYPRHAEYIDDVTVVVLKVRSTPSAVA